MPLNPKLSNESVNAEADAACALANTGYLRIYNGTQAATADIARPNKKLIFINIFTFL